MSYDVDLVIDTGGPEPATVWGDWNYTYNCAEMWGKAGIDLNAYHGKPAAECIPLLRSGIAELEDHPGKYKPMNPKNGWGGYDSSLTALRKMFDGFVRHPKAIVKVS